jgi:hypothetical protein
MNKTAKVVEFPLYKNKAQILGEYLSKLSALEVELIQHPERQKEVIREIQIYQQEINTVILGGDL